MPVSQPHFPFLPEPLQPLSTADVAAALEAGIRAGAAGNLSRQGDLFLASLCGRLLAERLDRAGLVVLRRSDEGWAKPDRIL